MQFVASRYVRVWLAGWLVPNPSAGRWVDTKTTGAKQCNGGGCPSACRFYLVLMEFCCNWVGRRSRRSVCCAVVVPVKDPSPNGSPHADFRPRHAAGWATRRVFVCLRWGWLAGWLHDIQCRQTYYTYVPRISRNRNIHGRAYNSRHALTHTHTHLYDVYVHYLLSQAEERDMCALTE